MEAKLSPVRTISAASLETSVPLIPIATPTSACLSAGASLTPSPVMDTTLPFEELRRRSRYQQGRAGCRQRDRFLPGHSGIPAYSAALRFSPPGVEVSAHRF